MIEVGKIYHFKNMGEEAIFKVTGTTSMLQDQECWPVEVIANKWPWSDLLFTIDSNVARLSKELKGSEQIIKVLYG